MIGRLKKVLLSIELFSHLVINLPLRKYQLAPANAVIDSCLHQKGLEFLWIFPRQSGKDEAIAQMVTFLLTLFHRVEACIVHVYPTAQQITTGTTRLGNRLTNAWTCDRAWTRSKPIRLGLEQAVCVFFSGHPRARAEGATANLLLIVNETQDQHEATIERRFTPMRASTNATALYVGTVRTSHDFLWRTKTRLERAQALDGVQRVFQITPQQIGRENPHYQVFVDSQVRLKGRQHPSVRTELFNEPLDTAAGLFPARRRALMQGDHPRILAPEEGCSYLATIDIGGQDEASTAPGRSFWGEGGALSNPNRDYTVCTISRVRRDPDSEIHRLGYQVVNLLVDQGSRHFQASFDRPCLYDRLLAYLKHWRPRLVVCDMSGVGQGITDALAQACPFPVHGFDFARKQGKARLGNDFLALVETGRFKYFADEREQEGSDAWWFFTQAEHCAYDLAEGLPIERGLRWGVPDQATVILSDGRTVPIHDDRLVSAALAAHADQLIRQGEVFLSTGDSAVIESLPPDETRWS